MKTITIILINKIIVKYIMESVSNEEFTEFKTNIKKYITYDDDIKKINELLKKKKKEKSDISSKILSFMENYNIEDLSTGNGKLKRSVSLTKKPISKHIIKNKLSQYFNDDVKAEHATTFILENRETQERVRLKRFNKKL